VGDVELVVLLLVVGTTVLAVLVAVVSTAILEAVLHDVRIERGSVAECRAGIHGRVRVIKIVVFVNRDVMCR
jgi:hypothetical protein